MNVCTYTSMSGDHNFLAAKFPGKIQWSNAQDMFVGLIFCLVHGHFVSWNIDTGAYIQKYVWIHVYVAFEERLVNYLT